VLDEINRREHSPVRAGSNPKETQLSKQECVFELAGLEPPTFETLLRIRQRDAKWETTSAYSGNPSDRTPCFACPAVRRQARDMRTLRHTAEIVPPDFSLAVHSCLLDVRWTRRRWFGLNG
jgi:hypothetical protein